MIAKGEALSEVGRASSGTAVRRPDVVENG
jgi:hypothetical protein